MVLLVQPMVPLEGRLILSDRSLAAPLKPTCNVSLLPSLPGAIHPDVIRARVFNCHLVLQLGAGQWYNRVLLLVPLSGNARITRPGPQ